MSPKPFFAALASLLLSAGPLRANELAEIHKLQAAGDRAAALQRSERALQSRPKDASLRFVHGVLLLETGRKTEALEAFQRLSDDHPELADPLNNIAVLQAAEGRLDAARAALESALRNDPRHRAVRENLADVHVLLAIRLWAELQAEGMAEAGVQRRLRLARELLRAPAP